MLYDLIELIAGFFINYIPDELHREHEEKYGIPGQCVKMRRVRRALFLITAVIIAVFLLALPIMIFVIHEG